MKNKNLLLFILAVGVFSILNTEMGFIGILPYIAEEYNVTIVQAGWLISLFSLGVAVAGPTMPLMMSRFNRKHVMVFILGLFTLCNVVAGVPVSNFLVEQISLSASMTFFAVATLLVLLATLWLIPSMPAQARMSYGSQLSVLKKPGLWASIVAVIFLNGSIFGVFNYLADFLSVVSGVAPALVSMLLLVYGLCNIFSSVLAGNLLTIRPLPVIKAFPLVTAMLYGGMFGGGSAWPFMGAVLHDEQCSRYAYTGRRGID